MINTNEVLREYFPLYNSNMGYNFSHVTHNLIALAQIADICEEEELVKSSLDSLEKYLSLLDEFSEFKNRELTQNTKDTLSSVDDYINLQFQRLKGKSPE